MSMPFNADEIFEMAEQIERNGVKFYRKAAESAKDAGVRQDLLDLAKWEEQHESTFAAMRKELTAEEKAPTAFDPEGQAALYLRAFADGQVFDVTVDPSERLSGEEKPEEVIHIAAGLEKDSIVFYLGMKEMVPERLGKDKVDRIIAEEMKHIVVLNKHLAGLK